MGLFIGGLTDTLKSDSTIFGWLKLDEYEEEEARRLTVRDIEDQIRILYALRRHAKRRAVDYIV